jgi:chromatin remodeling complex protein RSC6
VSTKIIRKRTKKAKEKASGANFGERARKKLKERAKTKKGIKRAPEARKPSVAFMRPVQPDDKLSAIVGSKPLLRSELTKKLWDYIKKNGCQDKKKRTMINADDTLRPVFNGKSQVSMFQMMKLTSGHIK